MNKLIIDIETIPNQKLKDELKPQFNESTVKIGNLKDPEKVKAKIDSAKGEFENGLTKKMSIESNYCQILSLGYIELDENDKVIKQDVVLDAISDAIIMSIFETIYNGQTIIGWNSKNFDIPILWKRAILNHNKPSFVNYRKLCNPYTDESIDLMYHWNAGGYGKMIDCASLLGIGAKDGMDGSMIYDAFKESKFDEIKAYNMQDCECTLAIYRKIMA